MQNITVDSSYMKKDEMIAFMSKHNIEILNMIPNKVGVAGENYLKKNKK